MSDTVAAIDEVDETDPAYLAFLEDDYICFLEKQARLRGEKVVCDFDPREV